MAKPPRRLLGAAVIVVALLGWLCWPAAEPRLAPAAGHPYYWDRAELFAALERDFAAARALPPDAVRPALEQLLAEADRLAAAIAGSNALPAAELERLTLVQFQCAALVAAHPEHLERLRDLVTRARLACLGAAGRWPLDTPRRRELLYQVIHGGRAALEEALVQVGPATLPAVTLYPAVASSAPGTTVHGVPVHTGDIVLSRGGAPTSALIARGNDFAGNFSHVAVVHVDPQTRRATVIESLIERGLVTSTLEEFLGDQKLRLLLLRPLPELVAPKTPALLTAVADTLALAEERSTDYDFAMRWQDPNEMFCSEVAHHAFRRAGMELWPEKSQMSAPGLAAWLGGLGVRELTTLVPSDLEYDPQLLPVAEWRDLGLLRKDRRDNAIVDALLEAADAGARLDYSPARLPLARLVKAWSVVQDAVGSDPVIPRGMSAAAALRVQALGNHVFPALAAAVEEEEARFFAERGFAAPYWQLVRFAAERLEALRPRLSPHLVWDAAAR
jgi:hypothetical protein